MDSSSRDMLRVYLASGTELAAFTTEDLSSVEKVRALKQRLESLCGLPRFRQRLLYDGVALEDDIVLATPMDLHLLLLPLSDDYQKARELVEASARGFLSQVEALLQLPQDPDVITQDQQEDHGTNVPLHSACKGGHLEVARLLLEARADPDHATASGATPLFSASKHGHEDIVRLLLEANADVGTHDGHCKVCRNIHVELPLPAACAAGCLKIAVLLLSARADIEAGDAWGDPPLMCACLSKHFEMVQLLVEAGADVNKPSEEGVFPLYLATCAGHMGMVRTLLEVGDRIPASGQDPSAERHGDDTTALHLAVRTNSTELLQLLLMFRADKDGKDSHGNSPLLLACLLGFHPMVLTLVAAGADKEARSGYGETPLIVATFAGDSEIVSTLLLSSADHEARNAVGKTPLEVACDCNHGDVVKLLLLAGADKNSQNADGETLLDLFSSKVHVSVQRV